MIVENALPCRLAAMATERHTARPSLPPRRRSTHGHGRPVGPGQRRTGRHPARVDGWQRRVVIKGVDDDRRYRRWRADGLGAGLRGATLARASMVGKG